LRNILCDGFVRCQKYDLTAVNRVFGPECTVRLGRWAAKNRDYYTKIPLCPFIVAVNAAI